MIATRKSLSINLLGLVLGLALALVLSMHVSAASNRLPDSSVGGNWQDKYLEISVANPALGNALEARSTYVKFYFRSSSGQIQIGDADFCGAPRDGTSVQLNEYRLFRAGGDEKYNNLPSNSPAASYTSANRATSTGNCEKDGDRRVTLNISGLQPSTLPGRNGQNGSQQYYVAVLQVRAHSSSIGGVNAFKLYTPSSGAIIGYAVNAFAFTSSSGGGSFCDYYTSSSPCYARGPFSSSQPIGDQDAFAIQDRTGAPGSFSTFRFEFAPNCNITGNRSIYLKWFDLDYGTSNQTANPVMRLIRYPRTGGAGVEVFRRDSGWASGSGRYEYQQVTINGQYRYIWEWANIQKENGVQLWLPFDSANFNFGCPDSTPTNSGSCSLTLPGGSVVAPGATYTVNYRVNNTGASIWPVDSTDPPSTSHAYHLRRTDPSPNINERIRGGGVRSTGFGPVLDPGRSATWSVTRTAPASPGPYTETWRIIRPPQGAGGGHNPLPSGPSSCSYTISVGYRPYHKVYGGDVAVGRGFRGPDGSVCDTAAGATISGWHSTSLGGRGAGTQLAAFALGEVVRFASGQQFGGSNYKALTFANSGPGTPSTDYGGGLAAGNIPCMPDYWVGVPATANGLPNINVDEGVYRVNGNTAISGGTLGAGRRITIYVDGSVRITNNIFYSTGSYSSIDNIPSFRLIVRGNIYVEPGVTELNGLFVAMPRIDGTGGRFMTCSRTGAYDRPDLQSHLSVGGPCHANRLTVYGAVAARYIDFFRTRGDVLDSSTGERWSNSAVGNPAEKFIYTPELWLTSDFSSSSGDSAAIATMPPIL